MCIRDRIKTIEGPSTENSIVEKVYKESKKYNRIMVCLDSNHTHQHVLQELHSYAKLVTKECYCVVWDSGIETLPEGFITNRPWGKGNNPATAVDEYLSFLQLNNQHGYDNKPLQFEINKTLEHKLDLTSTYNGFLRRM